MVVEIKVLRGSISRSCCRVSSWGQWEEGQHLPHKRSASPSWDAKGRCVYIDCKFVFSPDFLNGFF